MKRPIEPKTGWPWSRPGYTFSLQPVWPPKFKPQEYRAPQDHSAISTRARNTALERGDTGSIRGGLSARSAHVRSEPARAMVGKAGRA